MKRWISAWLAALALLCACGKTEEPAVTANPYEGMIEVDSGYGTRMWVELYEDVPVSTLKAEDFRQENGRVVYTGSELETLEGIDVSEHQGVIDWEAVAADGVDFAIIRAGYRGYSEGGLFEDKYFRMNMTGAVENGIRIGVYFFSQAVTAAEAEEEAAYLLELLGSYAPEVVELPVFYDWESIGVEDARTDGMDGEAVTACAAAFCGKIQEAGYTPAVYAYRYLAYFYYDLSQLKDYQLWIGAVGGAPDFYYAHDIWQYSTEGRVAGIEGDVDMNLLFLGS